MAKSMFKKVRRIGLSKFNNAEYTSLMNQTKTNVENYGHAKLGIAEELWESFGRNIMLLTDISNQVKSSKETARMQELDKKRTELTTFIFQTIRTNTISPVTEMKAASEELIKVVNTYAGLQSLPVNQKTQQIKGFIFDMKKDEVSDEVAVLNLGTTLQMLEEVNNEYDALSFQRTEVKVEKELPSAKSVREVMDVEYETMMDIIDAQATITKSEEIYKVIDVQNALVDEYESNLKHRLVTMGDDEDMEAVGEE